jgi:hypothetical protein
MPPKIKKPVKLFRKEPPRDFVESVLKEMGFLGFHDLRWFSRDEIRLNTMDIWLPDLESYYLPCKAKRFLYNWSDGTPITVLRHILHSHGYDLQKEERLYKGSKTMLYQIQPVQSQLDLSGAILQVDFD